jgi:hypothetical protein
MFLGSIFYGTENWYFFYFKKYCHEGNRDMKNQQLGSDYSDPDVSYMELGKNILNDDILNYTVYKTIQSP